MHAVRTESKIGSMSMFWLARDIIIITAVISIPPYLTDKGEHADLYKINNNVCIKTSNNKSCSHNIIFLTCRHTIKAAMYFTLYLSP